MALNVMEEALSKVVPGAYRRLSRVEWRLILDGPDCGVENMAKDEAILRAGERGGFTPAVRLYEWITPTLSIGYRQNPMSLAGCGVPFVRRITGGRAVLHHAELTYSLVCDSTHPLFSAGILGAYMTISGCIVNALRGIGIEASFPDPEISDKRGTRPEAGESCFHAPRRYEILADGRKIVGSCQRRFKKTFLQHGSILFGVDKDLVRRIFGAAAIEKMSWVGAFSDAGKEGFRGILAERLEEGLKVRFKESALSSEERRLKDLVREERYSKSGWNMDGAAGDIERRLASFGI
ncbi:MAG: lipoate--protein ligase family protein [Deltaproteobacteria bacterium]|nr:lipoate--protein ligase family protein [Deltaproteobacteria bacterium]